MTSGDSQNFVTVICVIFNNHFYIVIIIIIIIIIIFILSHQICSTCNSNTTVIDSDG